MRACEEDQKRESHAPCMRVFFSADKPESQYPLTLAKHIFLIYRVRKVMNSFNVWFKLGDDPGARASQVRSVISPLHTLGSIPSHYYGHLNGQINLRP